MAKAKRRCGKLMAIGLQLGFNSTFDTSLNQTPRMAQPAETASTITRLTGSDNLKRHEALLEEMRKLETDKLLVLDRVYRYEFAQPTDDGKLYAEDTTLGKIRACKWEPHVYAYDSKEIGGST